MTIAYVLFFATLYGAAAWKLHQLARAPRDAPLRAITFCLVCAAASYALAMPDGSGLFNGVIDHGTAKTAQNVLLLGACYFLMCFYLRSAKTDSEGRRRARKEALALILVAAIATITAIVAPGRSLSHSFSDADMTIPHVCLFYSLSGIYMMYAVGAAFWWTRCYAHLTHRPHSTGLWLTVWALAGVTVAGAVRIVFVLVQSQGISVPPAWAAGISMLYVTSVGLFTIGLTYSAAYARLARIRLWNRHRRLHHRLYPLWRLLTDASPQDIIVSGTVPYWDSHRQFYRRVVEIRDGLIRISPYLRLENGSTPGTEDVDQEHMAQHLREAVNMATRQARPATVPLGVPALTERQLVALSDALAPDTCGDRDVPMWAGTPSAGRR